VTFFATLKLIIPLLQLRCCFRQIVLDFSDQLVALAETSVRLIHVLALALELHMEEESSF
jgi:hypothetical protein